MKIPNGRSSAISVQLPLLASEGMGVPSGQKMYLPAFNSAGHGKGVLTMKKVMSGLLSICLLLLLTACDTKPADGSGTETAVDATQPTSDAEPNTSDAAFGTRQNPVPLETNVKVGPNWNVAVIEVVSDAWQTIEQENQFNDPPAEGRQFVMAMVRISYVGDESGTPWIDMSFRYLGSDGNVYGASMDDHCGVIPDSLTDIGEQFPGASADGNVCWSVPQDAVAGGSIIGEESFSFDDTRVFFEGSR